MLQAACCARGLPASSAAKKGLADGGVDRGARRKDRRVVVCRCEKFQGQQRLEPLSAQLALVFPALDGDGRLLGVTEAFAEDRLSVAHCFRCKAALTRAPCETQLAATWSLSRWSLSRHMLQALLPTPVRTVKASGAQGRGRAPREGSA